MDNIEKKMPFRKRILLKLAATFTRVTTLIPVTDAHNGLRVLSFKAAKLIDENWTGGVAKNWAGFFVEYSPELEKKLAVGEDLVFSDDSTRKVIRQEHAGKFLNIYLQ